MAKNSLVVIPKSVVILSDDLPRIGHKYKADKKWIIFTTTGIQVRHRDSIGSTQIKLTMLNNSLINLHV